MSRGMPEFEDHPASYLGSQLAAVIRGRCVHVVDGDTYDIVLDLGFLQYALITVRLLDADTPELNSADPLERIRATKAKDRAIELLLNRHVLVRSYKDRRTFGRYVAEVWVLDETVDIPDLPRAEVLAIDGSAATWLPMRAILVSEALAVPGSG